MKRDCFTKGYLLNVRLLLVAELPPPQKQNMPGMCREIISRYHERCSLMSGMRLDRTRSSSNQATRFTWGSQSMTEFDELEVKEWLREIRIEKLDRKNKPVPTKSKPTFNNQGFK